MDLELISNYYSSFSIDRVNVNRVRYKPVFRSQYFKMHFWPFVGGN